jgi:chemotaxis protein methyltransferase CheR
MARVAEVIRERAGLTFPDARVRDVEATVQRAMERRALGGIPELLRVLDEDPPARDALVAELTVGETYFLRDPAQFELLRRRVLPELLTSRTPDRPIRVWSAGCASGEEPYSVAMLLDELGALQRAQITGTDIARPRLTDAQRAIYSRWSLRGSTEAMRARYFRERGRYFELTPRIRERVDFRYLNLAEDRFPSLAAGIWGMDVILCRNVLIYFDESTVERVARRLIASLSEDGWLILGASDPAIAERVACDVVLTDAGLVYRRPGAAGDEARNRGAGVFRGAAADGGTGGESAAPAAAGDGTTPTDREVALPGPWPMLPPDALPPSAVPDEGAQRDAAPAAAPGEPAASETAHAAAPAPADAAVGRAGVPELEARLVAAYDRRDFEAVAAAAESASHADLTERSWVMWLRALANQGCLERAGIIAARALAVRGPTPELLYLHAVLLLQTDRAADAASVVRRALYLDRRMIVGHLTLADAQRRMGNLDGARRSLRNAATLLAELPPETHVPASDGDTAGRLAELVRVKLRLLDEAA